MKIPVGQFGYSVPEPAQAPDLTAPAQAADRLGGILQQVGARADERDQELARAKDTGAYAEHQFAVDQLKVDYASKIASGEVPYQTAQQQFTADAQKIPVPKPQARGPVATQTMQSGVNMTLKNAQLHVGIMVDQARDKDLQSQGALQLDTLGKRAGLPGADIDSINRQADTLAPLLRNGGLNEAQVTRTLQGFKDQNWFNQATQAAMMARTSLPALDQIEHDLTAADGFYANRMDTDKRNTVLNQVIGHRIQLENKLQADANRRDAKAERALYEIDRQISSGVPATQDQWTQWGNTIQGTTFEDEYKQRAADEQQVQQVLRLPVTDQVKFVQDKEASLMQGGGSVREAQNLARLKGAVTSNVNLMQQAPLLFTANRTGQQVPSLDFSVLATPGGADELASQLHDRAVTIDTMRKQYGEQVQNKPLLPEEAQQIAGALDKATPESAVGMFAQLRQAAGNDQTYMALMQQVAPDSPIKSLAGMLAARERSMTLERHWFGPDTVASSPDVATTLLNGEALLNKSKTQKAEDGKPRTGLYMPSSDLLQADFKSRVGNAFADRPQSAELAFQAVQAYYVGKAAQTGRLASDNKDIDSQLLKDSITATLGQVVNVNGNGDVLAPWGMDASRFQDKAEAAFLTQTAQLFPHKDASQRLAAYKSATLKNAGDGTYYVTIGRNYLTDIKGQPVIIDVGHTGATGTYTSAPHGGATGHY